jgi:hypothetical protein
MVKKKPTTYSVFFVGLDEKVKFGRTFWWGLLSGLVIDTLVGDRCTGHVNKL